MHLHHGSLSTKYMLIWRCKIIDLKLVPGSGGHGQNLLEVLIKNIEVPKVRDLKTIPTWVLR